jgi:serine/threonine-protein kinase RsbW
MLLRLALSLPRDAATVSMTRRVLDNALAAIGVVEECRDDICLALTEACGNVIAHARAGEIYDVSVTTEADQCVIEVTDSGVGAELGDLPTGPPDDEAETGRGLLIIRAMTDVAQLTIGPTGGLSIRMVKQLQWRADAPLQRLRERTP